MITKKSVKSKSRDSPKILIYYFFFLLGTQEEKVDINLMKWKITKRINLSNNDSDLFKT